MHILVLGGTVFLGRHFVDAAASRGHEVTLFNRGKHNPELFPDLEKLRGDRDGGLDPLRGRRFDAVADMCGYVPRIVGDSARLLADACDRYLFVSSLSAYADVSEPDQDEEAPVARIDDETVEEINADTYGALKVLCEEAVERALPGRTLIIRPGLIVGAHDPSDRFTYWPLRVARGGDVLVPEPADFPVEYTDVRDLCAFMLHGLEAGLSGVYNVSGPVAGRTSLGELVQTCADVTNSAARWVWVPEEWLTTRGVELWKDLPVRVGADAPGFSTRSTQKAWNAGLRFRPAEETVRDTLVWAQGRPDGPLRAGLDPEREVGLLAEWRRESAG